MNLQNRKIAFIKLRSIIDHIINNVIKIREFEPEINNICNNLLDTIHSHQKSNPWFTPQNIGFSLKAISGSLTETKVDLWIKKYSPQLKNENPPLTIGNVMAGNIPLVGFFDLFYVLMSGNKFLGKLSSGDNKLLPLLCELLINIEPEFEEMIEFKDDKLTGFDAIIATGSDNTARYFDYYFGKYPNIIRKNRNGVAVLTGRESNADLSLLGMDIFLYFGLGCRNVAKIYVPESYSFDVFFDAVKDYNYVVQNHKYKNNYDYYKSIFIINEIKFYDNGFVTLRENPDISSAVSTLHYEYYENSGNLKKHLKRYSEHIQCIVADKSIISNSIPFGYSQLPQLWDYADNIDTMQFLLDLSS